MNKFDKCLTLIQKHPDEFKSVAIDIERRIRNGRGRCWYARAQATFATILQHGLGVTSSADDAKRVVLCVFIMTHRGNHPLLSGVLNWPWGKPSYGLVREAGAKREHLGRCLLAKYYIDVGSYCRTAWDSLAAEAERLLKAELPAVPTEEPTAAEASNLHNLREEFAKLSNTKDRKAAGLAFEKFLTSLFELFNLAPRGGFRVVGEQIDGAFELDHESYIVEAKWEQNPMAEAELLVFRGKIEGKSLYTRGVFIAINGISKPAEQAITTGKQACFFIVDGHDLNAVLEGKIPLDTLLRNKQRRLAEEGKIMATYDEF